MLLFALLTLGQMSWSEDINISSASDWQSFANRVNAGETRLNACLTQDIDLATFRRWWAPRIIDSGADSTEKATR
jgi:hypothetical protein